MYKSNRKIQEDSRGVKLHHGAEIEGLIILEKSSVQVDPLITLRMPVRSRPQHNVTTQTYLTQAHKVIHI